MTQPHDAPEGGEDRIDGVTNHPLVSEVLDDRDSGAGIRVILKPGATFAGVDVARFATHAAAVEALQGVRSSDKPTPPAPSGPVDGGLPAGECERVRDSAGKILAFVYLAPDRTFDDLRATLSGQQGGAPVAREKGDPRLICRFCGTAGDPCLTPAEALGDCPWFSSADQQQLLAALLRRNEPSPCMLEVGLETMQTNNVLDSSEQGRVRRIYRAMEEVRITLSRPRAG